MHILFPSKIHKLSVPSPRTLKATNRKDIIKFLTHIENTNKADQLLQELQQLLKQDTWSPEFSKQFENLDELYTKLLLDAEQSLVIHRDHPWSPALHRSYLLYTYWRKYNSAKDTNTKIQEQLQDLHLQLQDDIYFKNKYRHPRRQLDLARKQWQQCKIDAQILRDDHLTTRQEISVLAGNTSKTKAIKTLKRNERKNRMLE